MSDHQRCMGCKNLAPGGERYYCRITMKIVETDCGFTVQDYPEWCPLDRNCHEYCRYGKMCRYAKGENGFNPDDCAMYYKIEDILNDARDIEQEQRRAMGEDDDW